MRRGAHPPNDPIRPLLAALGACALLAAPGLADSAPWRFRLGPLVEFGRDEAGIETRAIRPLFTSRSDPDDDSGVCDVAWPAASFFRRGAHETGRVLIAGWSDGADAPDARSRSSRWLFPVYLGGRTRAGESYGAVIPFYGDIPELFLVQDIRFVLFPFYLRYRTAETERRFMPWPLVRRAERDDGDLRYSFFPFYGTAKTDGTVRSYCFWPFWTRQVFEREGRRGEAEMLFPVYGRVETEAERSWMALPPFIYHGSVSNRMGVSTCTRAPWPFLVFETGPGYARESYWPVYGWKRHTLRDSVRNETYALWPIAQFERRSRPGARFASDQIFPFYYSEERADEGRDGGGGARERYTRVWPLWSYQARDGRFRLRLLELWPMRNGGGIERNWAPFWTWFVRTGGGGAARDTDLLWGLVRWGETPRGGRYGQVSGLVSWQRAAADGTREWRVLGLRISDPGVPDAGEEGQP